MRDWQVGDPVGDGNDIGVPDTRYMGYLRDDEEDNDELVDEFRFCFTQFHGGFEAQNYENAFFYLKEAFEIYQDLNHHQRQELSDNPFAHPFVVELCSAIYNMHDGRENDVMEIIKRQKIPVIRCEGCHNLYPPYYRECHNCGRSFESSPEDAFSQKLTEALQKIVYDKAAISQLVRRTKILMESNDSRLVKIEEPDLLSVNFIFEKEHEYFKTTYTCIFLQEYHETRIFDDYWDSNDHTKLLQNQSFQKSVKDTERRTGFRFMECRGGYGSRLDENRYDFVFTDDIYVIARFDMGNGHIAVFDVDLDNLKLSDDYREY